MSLHGQGFGEPHHDLGASGLCPSLWDLLVSHWLGPDPDQQAGFQASLWTCLISTMPPLSPGCDFGWRGLCPALAVSPSPREQWSLLLPDREDTAGVVIFSDALHNLLQAFSFFGLTYLYVLKRVFHNNIAARWRRCALAKK